LTLDKRRGGQPSSHPLTVGVARWRPGDGGLTLYSGHASRSSLEIYSKISLAAAQDTYDKIIDQFPI